MNAGTTFGTDLLAFHWNEVWNAERRKPAPALAFHWNDRWNDTRLPHLERSTHPLRGGPVERAERQ